MKVNRPGGPLGILRGGLARSARVSLLIAAVLLGSLAIAACGGSGSTSSGSSNASSTTGGSGTSTCAKNAQAVVAQYSKPMHIVYPSHAVTGVSKLKGKTIWFIESLNSSYEQTVAKAFSAAALAAGLKPKIFSGQGTVTSWNQGIEEAVSQHAGAILLLSEAPSLVSGSLSKAFAAHIPVVDSDNSNPSDPLDGLFAHVSANYTQVGKVQAAMMLDGTNCKANVFYAGYTLFKNLREQEAGVTGYLKSECPSCSYTFYAVNPTTEATTLPAATLTALRRNPNTNVVAGVTDIQIGEMLPSLQQNGNKYLVVGQSAQTPWSTWVQNGSENADVAEGSQQYIGWAEVDEILRAMTGAHAVTEDIPIQIMKKGDYNPSNPFSGLGDYQAKFKKLWGVS